MRKKIFRNLQIQFRKKYYKKNNIKKIFRKL
jgi:hypothetical protein